MFPKIGVPQNGWFIMENPIKMDYLGVPLFLGRPYTANWGDYIPPTSLYRNLKNPLIHGKQSLRHPSISQATRQQIWTPFRFLPTASQGSDLTIAAHLFTPASHLTRGSGMVKPWWNLWKNHINHRFHSLPEGIRRNISLHHTIIIPLDLFFSRFLVLLQ